MIAILPVIIASVWIADLAVWEREGQWIAKVIMLFVGMGLSVTGYVGIHALLGSEELEQGWGMIKKKFPSRLSG